MDTSEPSQEQDQRSGTPQPQSQPQQQQPRNSHLSFPRSSGKPSIPHARQHHHHQHHQHGCGSFRAQPQQPIRRSTQSIDEPKTPLTAIPTAAAPAVPTNAASAASAPAAASASAPAASSHGTFSNFQIPSDILKNLTPIIKSPPRDKTIHNTRRKTFVRNVQLRLNAQNNKVDKQIRRVKQEQMKLIQLQSEKLNNQLENARYRRREYLDSIREKAVKCISNRCQGSIKKEAENLLIFHLENSAGHHSDWKRVKRICQIMPCIVPFIRSLQNRAKEYIFIKHTKFIKQALFLTKFEEMSFGQVLTSLNSESSIKISLCYILQYLRITRNPYETRSFLYCFIMISDFKDCMENGPNHPGFNCNYSTFKSQNGNGGGGGGSDGDKISFFNNCVWVMLYKICNCMIEEFKVVVDLKCVTSKFNDFWKDFKFIFRIFKWNHLKGVKSLLYESISIADEQLSILQNNEEDDDQESLAFINQQRAKLNLELSLLNRYNVQNLKQFNELDKVVEFTNSMSRYIDDLYLQLPESTVPSFIQNKPNFICFDTRKFYIPEMFPVDKWRSYWITLYFHEYQNKRTFPKKLKSGYLGEVEPSTKRNLDYIALVDSILDIDTLDLSKVFEYLYDFYLEFSNSIHSLPHISNSIKDIYKIEKLISHYSDTNIGKLFQFDGKMDAQDPTHIKYHVITQWVKKCQFDKLDDFTIFENLYLVVSSDNFKNLRYSIFTQNPNLLFPNFYKVLMQMGLYNVSFDDEQQVKNIINASIKTRIKQLFTKKSYHIARAANFFNHVFNYMIIYQTTQPNELNSNFKLQFDTFSQRLNKLIDLNCLAVMYRAFTGVEMSRPTLQAAYASLDNLSDKHFIAYFKTHSSSIRSLLCKKWLDAMGKEDGISEVLDIFKHCFYYLQEAEMLSREISQFNSFLYLLYRPILNWIYEDIGMS
ncbi:hypothetical protein KGF56_000411 [Candida oxycetoniae]|uniref:Uncharacterized protein n=1 Tax=Candida oxycetoniae TaxID=497107 RepID=A0AAI9WZV3_9ASCO|nr:uncharacterized protein KGF56_000411 [Candida oxycetoniae]KAI3406806.2 hypothetical protein KGF56_000411 [Candida oxycetoniae]